jgi:hypothetical protein
MHRSKPSTRRSTPKRGDTANAVDHAHLSVEVVGVLESTAVVVIDPGRAIALTDIEMIDTERRDLERIDPERIDPERIDLEIIDAERIDTERIVTAAGRRLVEIVRRTPAERSAWQQCRLTQSQRRSSAQTVSGSKKAATPRRRGASRIT